MARGYLKEKDYIRSDFKVYIQRTMRVLGYTQEQMAEKLGITRQTFAERLENGTLTYNDLLTIFDTLKIPENTILFYLRFGYKR